MSTPRWLLRVGVAAAVVGGMSCAGQASRKPATMAEFDRQTAGKDRKALAEYVFNTYDCASCHTVAADGKTGFTSRGEEARQGSVGCVRLLTTVNASVTVPEGELTAEERRRHEQFKEFGCVFCHQVTPGKMGFTEIGGRLASLHLGCVEVQHELTKRSGT